MIYPPLTDDQALQAAHMLHLRNPAAVLQPGLVRSAVELAHWARLRDRDAAMQRYLSHPDYKRVAAGDTDD